MCKGNAKRACLSSLGSLRWWNALYRAAGEGRARMNLERVYQGGAFTSRKLWTRSGSQDARPQNTDWITRHITLDYIPLSKGAEGNSGSRRWEGGSKIQEIPSWKSLSAPRHPVYRKTSMNRGGGQVRLFWHSGNYLYAICRTRRRRGE